MQVSAILIVTAAARANARLVWQAMGRGPNSFLMPLTDDADPTPESTVTHWAMHDGSATDTDVAEWQALTNGDLPAVPEGTVWGEDDVISAADAIAACSAANLQVYSAAGSVVPLEHMEGVIAGRGLRVRPSEL